MSDLTRRNLLRGLVGTVAAAASAEMVSAQQTAMPGHHAMTEPAKAAPSGVYHPKAFNAHEYATLERLTDLIIPADAHSPGAKAAGAAAWIDMLAGRNAQILGIYTGGIAWLDHTMRQHDAKDFVSATEPAQHALLDSLAYKKNATPALAPGIHFFEWARRMTVDAYYTSPLGIRALDYRGNDHLREFVVPAGAMAYVNARSPI
jgi:gluconate 2-dehydrogenase gamma chain